MQGKASSSGFVHLHLHTQYSLLQGAIRIDDLLDHVAENGMNAVAMTDTHNLFGAIDFYTSARKKGIKPILGCEIFYAPQGRTAQLGPSQNSGLKAHHLVLLCKDLMGYQNLCQMVSRSYLDAPPVQKSHSGFPRAVIDKDLLDRYGDGLIVLSGCLRGELSSKIIFGEESAAQESIRWFQNRFKSDFFLELQDSGIPEQEHVNEVLFEWGKKFGISCVATVDCHYLKPEEGEAHEILQCIEHGKNLDFDRPKSLLPPEYYVKSPELMRERFERFPGVCDQTLAIADRCNVEFRFKDEKGRAIYHLPKFRPETIEKDSPEYAQFDLEAYFDSQARSGLENRFHSFPFEKKRSHPEWNQKKTEYLARLEEELSMIKKTGFAGYFLIVADFVNWAKTNGIPVGPGRGSGAGSLVAYALGIVNIDPIEFHLLFERFINPERISMPDFDIDFCQDRRGEVIDYVARRYGSENVCQIITFGQLQARAVVKDVGRVLGLSFGDTDQLTKLFPDELKITIEKALEQEPKLREKMESDPKVAKVIEYARSLEGLSRNAGIHAAGIIITEKPVVNYCPLYVGKDGAVVTQFDKDFSEHVGLVKFDFLGLKTLTVIDTAVRLVRETAPEGSPDRDFSIDRMNYEDPAVFSLISSGDTDGIFQLESSGMKDLCSKMRPSSLEDITAINALYRPGPLGSGMVDDFIDRKHGRKPSNYEFECLERILSETYGVILFQEQVMQIARELAGYSLGQADLLRRAMGKKKPEEMAEHHEIFIRGATAKGYDSRKAEGIFDLMAKFAEYGFNKSHSAAYGLITYQTAYLKAHYPAEFAAALMATEMDNTEKITKYIADARAHKIPVLPPNVNSSMSRFSVELLSNGKKSVRFGLEAVKGVGGVAVEEMIRARKEGPFKNVLDFFQRVPTRKVNKKILESLTLAGAFDTIAEVNRASLFASIGSLLEHAGDEQEERELGQASLFDAIKGEEVKLSAPNAKIFKEEKDWQTSQKLAKEKEVVGFFISGHPMDPWQKICEDWLGWNTETLKSHANERAARTPFPQQTEGYSRVQAPVLEAKIGGLISSLREVTTRKGTRMCFATLEDLYGKIDVVIFPDSYATMKDLLAQVSSEAEVIVLAGSIELSDEAPKIIAKTLTRATEAHRGRVQQLVLKISVSQAQPSQLRALKTQLIQNRGKCPVRIDFADKGFKTHLTLPKNLLVSPTPALVDSINKIFGENVVSLR